MKKLYCNRRPVEGPWGGGNLFVRAFQEYAPKFGYSVVFDLCPTLSAVLMLDPRDSENGPGIRVLQELRRVAPQAKVLHRVNECDARKATSDMDQKLRDCNPWTDVTVFVSNWIADYHLRRGWNTPDQYVIYNGVDSGHFAPQPKLGGGRIHLVTHHWSDNRLKGADIYEAVDQWIAGNSQFTFTYIGRAASPLPNTRMIQPLFGAALGRELGRYDVYISGSRFDPGPNHILESLACGLPTYVHRQGGGAVEFAGAEHAFNDSTELLKLLERQQFSANRAISLSSWESCIEAYCRVLASL